MLASNIHLDISVKELNSTKTSDNVSVKGNDSSSFSKHLEKEMNKVSEHQENKVPDEISKTNNSESFVEKTDKSEKNTTLVSLKDDMPKILLEKENVILDENSILAEIKNSKLGVEEVETKKDLSSDNVAELLNFVEKEEVFENFSGTDLSVLKDFAKEKKLEEKFSDSLVTKGVNSETENINEDFVSIKKTELKKSEMEIDDFILSALQNSLQDKAINNDVPNVDNIENSDNFEIPEIKLETGTKLDEKISVIDYRSAKESGVTETSLQDGNFVTSVSYNDGEANISFNLANGSENSFENSNFIPESSEQKFASMLSSQIQNSSADFVKTGSIILKDSNVGTINLILHPEELGNVKINLELNDNLISAKITVASEEAFQAFKDSIPSLKQAFAESGFQTGGFDLAWSGNGGENSQKDNSHFNQQQLFSFGQLAYEDMVSVEDDFNVNFDEKFYSDSSQIAVNIIA